ncbi:aminopeptidase N-like [Daphnia pulex]|uniref:aminopeptidase N-like n=1 Tax=Daphnia pulex TaxID=6669 RepID=UPI001EDDA7C2|nr:aminopeptidase N-like [Daphnia pulex]
MYKSMPLCWVLATLAACVFAMEAQDLEAAEQFYHIHGVYYPAWSVAVPAAVPPAYAVGGQLASFSPDPDPEATTNKAAAPDSSGSDKKDQPQHDTTSKKDVRLPRTVRPIHYDVRLFPVLEKGNFSILGQVSIDLQCQMETDRIVLHSADIVVDPQSVKVIEQGKPAGKTLTVASDGIHYDTDMEFLIIRLKDKDKLAKGANYTLSMNFVGNLTDQLRGLYRSTYKEDGVEKSMAVSQMEPTDARRAFPCFDEPNMKATFTVTLGRHRHMTALSNMPLIKTTQMEGMEEFYWDHFAPSVPMSTYLVAFIVANFTQVEADVGNATWKFNIYARPSARNQTQYASEIGPKIQTFFEDYFQIPFPLPKQDMIAIPDFASGAMENWGLITYRETALLYDEKKSSVTNKERVCEVIAHELAHQWFGNLVTMDWWTDLWLNEGFASYAEYLGAQHVEPGLKWLQQFVTSELQNVMSLDALESSHPISVVVHHPNEIHEIFDRISYGKGATIIRMLAAFLGEKTFRQGLSNYLKSRQYGNAVQDDLWDALTKQAKVDKVPLPTDVKQIMDTWTLKMGFPVVTVTREYKNNSVFLSQERFLMQRSNASSQDKTVYLWWVPLTYTTDFETVGSTWLADGQTSKKHELSIPADKNQWVIFNVDQTGYYRINYDSKNWQMIGQQLMTNHLAISAINRAQIMDDSLNLAEAGLLDYETALNLTRYLEHEADYVPWDAALAGMNYISSMMSRTSGYGLLKKHFRTIIMPLYNLVGFDQKVGEDLLLTKLRTKAVSWACSIGNKDCISRAVNSYAQWMADPENIDIISPNLKGTVACTAIAEGDEVEWEFALNRYMASNVASERDVLLTSLSCSEKPWILAKMLEMSLNPTSGIRKQDAGRVISQVASNSLGRYMTFNFIREKWTELRKVVPTNFFSYIIKAVAKSFNTELELKEFIQFREDRSEELSGAERATEQAIDRAKNNLNWMRQNYQKVVDWLQRVY